MPRLVVRCSLCLPIMLPMLTGTCLTAQQLSAAKTAAMSHLAGAKEMHATGTFEVTIKPAEPSDIAKVADTGRMTIDKKWSGDLVGTSKGEMLTGLTGSTGSMAYVAMERVQANLAGHSGTFLFQHSATMLKGDAASTTLNITVVKSSGTEGLAGIAGTLAITITNGVHHYDFTYSLPGQQ